jgi:hypothetical protein
MSVTEEMKFFNVTKLITGCEPEAELRYFAQQAAKCIVLPKYREGHEDGHIVPSWKDILSPWFEVGSKAATFLRKKETISPNTLFEALIVRQKPKVKDYSISLLECIHSLVVPKAFDEHQLSIEKYVDDLVERRYRDKLTIALTEIIDLSKLPHFAEGKNANLLNVLTAGVNGQIRQAEAALIKKLSDDVSSELGMAMIGSDTNLFSVFEKKPNECSLSELVNVTQEKHLEADVALNRPDKLICLRYQKMGTSPILTKSEYEKSLKRKAEIQAAKLKAPKTEAGQSPQSSAKLIVDGAASVSGAKFDASGTSVQSKKVEVPCKLCLVSTDPRKKEKASFHKYERCFDHPTFGQSNKGRFRFGDSKNNSKK